jgi:adenine deaminase
MKDKIISGKIIDIHKRKIFPGNVIIRNGVILDIAPAENVREVYIMPGLVDAHIHIESSMITPGAFASAAVKHGTIGTISDPHEIANVMGMDGVNFMIEDGKKVPFKFFFGAPSCVPATEHETSGAALNIEEIRKLLDSPDIYYLSEMMNYPGVISDDVKIREMINAAISARKPIDGHAPGLSGELLRSYVSAGISTDHECSTIEEAREKLNMGMKIIIREGSAARNLDALKDLINSNPDRVMLCSDDLHPEMLTRGHINKLVSRLVSEGYDLFDVVRCATINPKEHYNLDTGVLKQGDPGDITVVDNPENMNVLETWINGEMVYSNATTHFNYLPGPSINNFHCSEIHADDIRLKAAQGKVRVIKAYDGELLTDEIFWEISSGGYIGTDLGRDFLKIIVKDRYNDHPPAVAFINGFGLKKGALASSVAHDSHNIICIGGEDSEIVAAVNEIIRIKGGLAVSVDGKVSSLQLDIAGIMTTRTCDEVATKYESLNALTTELGTMMKAPFMTLSFMALLVIPNLKISDKGLFDVRKFKHVPLFISE